MKSVNKCSPSEMALPVISKHFHSIINKTHRFVPIDPAHRTVLNSSLVNLAMGTRTCSSTKKSQSADGITTILAFNSFIICCTWEYWRFYWTCFFLLMNINKRCFCPKHNGLRIVIIVFDSETTYPWSSSRGFNHLFNFNVH